MSNNIDNFIGYDTNKYVYPVSFINMTFTNYVYSILGIFFGILINDLSIKTDKSTTNNNVSKVLIQIGYISVLLSILHYYLPVFGWSWQNITPGILFTSFLFGTQYVLFDTEKSVLEMISGKF